MLLAHLLPGLWLKRRLQCVIFSRHQYNLHTQRAHIVPCQAQCRAFLVLVHRQRETILAPKELKKVENILLVLDGLVTENWNTKMKPFSDSLFILAVSQLVRVPLGMSLNGKLSLHL